MDLVLDVLAVFLGCWAGFGVSWVIINFGLGRLGR